MERTCFGISGVLALSYLITHGSYLLPASLGLGALATLWILMGKFRIAPGKAENATG